MTTTALRSAACALVLTAAGLLPAAPAPAAAAPAACPTAATTAADEGSAAELARACGRRIEALSRRGESVQVFTNADGTSTMELSAAPQRVRRPDGSWAPIDTTLRAAADGSLAPVASTADVRFSPGGTGPLVTLSRGAQRFTLSWPAPLPRPVASGDTVTYAGVLPGVDLVLRATPSGFSHVLVVRSAAAAANPALRQIDYALGGDGVRVAGDGADGVSVTGADGSLLAYSGAAAMWDSSTAGAPSSAAGPGDAAREARAETRFAGGRLSVLPDAGLLTGPATRYPLYVDPVWWTPGASRWAYADSANADNDTTYARVGLDPDDGRLYRSFFEFPAQPLWGAHILSATFNAVLYHTWSCSASPVSAWRSGGIGSTPRTGWSPALQVYLATQSAAANKTDPACATSATPTLHFGGNPITNDLQSAINAGWATYTVALSEADSNGANESTQSRWKKFFTNQSSLSVNYNRAPDTPPSAQLSIDPSYPCGPSAPHVNTTNGVTLRAALSDPDFDNIRAHWQVNGIPAQYEPPDSAMAATGSTFTTTVPAAAFTDGVQYSWTARADDGTDAGGYGPSCPFVADNAIPGSAVASATDLALGTGLLVPAPPSTAVIGRPATVAFSPAPGDHDIAGYLYGVAAGAAGFPTTWVPAGAGGRAVAPVVPVASGSTVNYLTVQAKGLSGQVGGRTTFKFKANAPAAAPGRVPGDATGDGRADVTAFADEGGGNLALWRLDTTGDGAGTFTAIAPQDVATTYAAASTRSATGDFDGDGTQDVAVFQQQGSTVALSVQRSDGNALLGTQAWASPAGWNVANMLVVAGNFDGDAAHRDDLAVLYRTGSTTWDLRVFVASGSPGSPAFAAPAVWNSAIGSDFNAIKLVAGDFNGDGRADVAEVYNAGGQATRVFLHTSSGSALANGVLVWDSGAGAMDWSLATPVAADLNGDGFTDLAAFEASGAGGTRLRVWTAGASGLGQPAVWWDSGAYAWAWSQVNPVVGDFNGDGRADLAVILACCGRAQASVWKFLSTGGGLAGGAPTLAWQGALGTPGTGSMSPAGAGTFELVNVSSGKCVEVAGASTADQTTLDQWDCIDGAANEEFRFAPYAPDVFSIQPTHVSGKCFDVANGGTSNGTAIWQYPCNGTPAQRFQPVYLSGWGNDVVVELVVNFDGMCVDLTGAGPSDGTRIQEFTCNGTPAQQFLLRPVSAAAPVPAASWALNEPGGTTLVNGIAGGPAATLAGGAGVGGFHATFDGSSGYARTPGPIVDTSKSFTVSAWLRPTSVGGAFETGVAQEGATTSGFFLQYAGDTGQWCFSMRSADAASPTAYRACAPVTVRAGAWAHLTGVFDASSGQLRLYLNGSLAGSAAGPAVPWAAGGQLDIGRARSGGSPADWFAGDVDDVRLWSRALTADEMTAVFADRA